MTNTTSISIFKETKDILRKLGSKGQTYDKVIRELLKKTSVKGLDPPLESHPRGREVRPTG